MSEFPSQNVPLDRLARLGIQAGATVLLADLMPTKPLTPAEWAEVDEFTQRYGLSLYATEQVSSRAMPEQLFDFGAPTRSFQEVRDFGAWRGYNLGTTGTALTYLKNADSREVISAEHPVAATAHDLELELPIVIYDTSTQSPTWRLRVLSLEKALRGKSTLSNKPKIESLLADYLNHAIPLVEDPLEVAYPLPPIRTPFYEMTEADQRELLLQAVETENGPELLATAQACQELLGALGLSFRGLALELAFQHLVAMLAPGHVGRLDYEPGTHLNQNLVLIDYRLESSLLPRQGIFGIRPARLAEMIEKGEISPHKIATGGGYGQQIHSHLRRYVITFKAVFGDDLP